MPTRKKTSDDTAHQPQNALQRLKNRLQQKYNALRHKHLEERGAFRKIDKEMQRVTRSKTPLTQKEIRESRGVVSTVCHELKNKKLGTTLFNIVVGLIGLGILRGVQVKSQKSIENVVHNKLVYENKRNLTKKIIYFFSRILGVCITDQEKKWCHSKSTEHMRSIQVACMTNAAYNDKLLKLVNRFYRAQGLQTITVLLVPDYVVVVQLQRSLMPDDKVGEDDVPVFNEFPEHEMLGWSKKASSVILMIFLAPVTEELFKFCSLKLTDKSLVPTATLAYSELLMYAYTILNSGRNIPLKIFHTLLRFVIASLHLKTASKMKHAPVGQQYRTLGSQMLSRFKWNNSFANNTIGRFRLLIPEFKKLYRGEVHALKDTYQGVHLLLYGKTDKKIGSDTLSRRKRGYLQRFHKTKKTL